MFKLKQKLSKIKEWLKFIVLGFNNGFYDNNVAKKIRFFKAFKSYYFCN